MSIEDLISKIVLGVVTQQDFYDFSTSIDDLIQALTYSEKAEEVLDSFGFYTVRFHKHSMNIVGKESGRAVVKLIGGKKKTYTAVITYPV